MRSGEEERLVAYRAAAGVEMQAAHPTIWLQDTDSIAVLAVLTVRIAALLHAEYPAAGRFASGASGPIGIGEGAGRG